MPLYPNSSPDWLRPENASVFDPWYTSTLRKVVNILGLTDPQQVMGMGTAAEVPGEIGGVVGALAKRFPRTAAVIKAYHGSPHDFEQFDISKIGTGEGAQAYGHGLYFAENPSVAGSYKESVQARALYKGSPIENVPTSQQATYAKARELGISFPEAAKLVDHDRLGVLSYAQSYGKDAKRFMRDEAQKRLFDTMTASGELVFPEGKMYEVAIHADPEHFLDWDKPLSQQSEYVQEALGRAGVKLKPVVPWEPHQITAQDIAAKRFPSNYAPGAWASVQKDSAGQVEWHGGQVFSSYADAARNAEARTGIDARAARDKGSEIYHDIAQGKPEATQKLRDVGLQGIKYFDASSRTAKEGTRNYVAFDDKTIEILRKYGIMLPVAQQTLQQQQPQSGVGVK